MSKKQNLVSHSLHEAGAVFMERKGESLRERMRNRYPRAKEWLLFAAAGGALRSSIRYLNAATLRDETLRQAMRTTLRHQVVGADNVMNNVAAILGLKRLDQDQELYTQIKHHLCAIARLVEHKLEADDAFIASERAS